MGFFIGLMRILSGFLTFASFIVSVVGLFTHWPYALPLFGGGVAGMALFSCLYGLSYVCEAACVYIKKNGSLTGSDNDK